MTKNDDTNAFLYLLAGVGLGAIIGAAAGLLLAPKAGEETREELAEKMKELKTKTEEWMAEQKAKRVANPGSVEELGA